MNMQRTRGLCIYAFVCVTGRQQCGVLNKFPQEVFGYQHFTEMVLQVYHTCIVKIHTVHACFFPYGFNHYLTYQKRLCIWFI